MREVGAVIGAGARPGAGWRTIALGLALAPQLGCPSEPPVAAGTSSSGPGSSTAGSTTVGPVPDPTTSTTGTGPADTTEGDGLPPTPTLLSPADGATDLPLSTTLCWNPVDDPDGDAVLYRVFVDDIELTGGEQAEDEGVEGPCLGPLHFDHEQSYQWQVQAFEAGDPTRESARSDPWSFSIVADGQTQAVFEDRFDRDTGWTVGGDATAGAWTRGDPAPAMDGTAPSQPGQCIGGQHCYFTGQNMGGLAHDEDVAGGSTTLTSPPFDLSGATAATVQLWRYFYKSTEDAPAELRVELLVPDPAAPDGTAVHQLERLERITRQDPRNRWEPREYVACDVPMVEGTRLRITATDTGTGILEAAIDSVSVHAHSGAQVCGTGEGGRCEPTRGAQACADGRLCCGQGPLNDGVFRCRDAVPGLDFDDPTPDPEAPGNGPLGCPGPDLIIDPSWIQPVLTDIFVHEGTCELYEGCVGGLGWRTILRFSLTAANVGSDDLLLGVPANEPDLFHYSECHDHFHFDQFARFELRDDAGVVASGHKPGFCLLDSYSWAWPNTPGTYDCSTQGISAGHADIYESDLPCQWVDVTDVPPGDYLLWAELNVRRTDASVPPLFERDYGNGDVIVPVTIP